MRKRNDGGVAVERQVTNGPVVVPVVIEKSRNTYGHVVEARGVIQERVKTEGRIGALVLSRAFENRRPYCQNRRSWLRALQIQWPCWPPLRLLDRARSPMAAFVRRCCSR